MSANSASELYRACCTALAAALKTASPNARIDGRGYVRSIEENLIEGVRREDFEEDLRQGDGNELEQKFLATHSSSALAVNCFAPFKRIFTPLKNVGFDASRVIRFERKCPHGLGTKAPNLDVLLEAPSNGSVVGIESKCLEPIQREHPADFSPRYKAGIKDERRNGAWFREMVRLMAEPQIYRRLDAAQLVKHAFGIAHTFPGRPATLLYLFWEPSNADQYSAYVEHRRELADFAKRVAGGFPQFASLSYRDLWNAWGHSDQPEWVRTHVKQIRTRYDLLA